MYLFVIHVGVKICERYKIQDERYDLMYEGQNGP